MDAAPVGVGRLGYTRPEPTGVTVAISPFNYPAILVIHKIGPALAAGNAVVLKPAATTPLTALFLVERLVTAGLPPLALQCVIGPGATVGRALVSDARVRKVSFTGSYAVGDAIARAAGVKRLTCELGSNAAMVVFADADIERAAGAAAFSGFTNAGQNCVSTQRILVEDAAEQHFLELLADRIDALSPGDPADPRTDLAPVIDSGQAARVIDWIVEARAAGARVLRGGDRDGAVVAPSLIANPPPEARVWRDELFGPGVAVRSFRRESEALDSANDTRYGLAMSVMTRDLDRALRFANGLRSGMVNVNSPNGSTWRADFMPWGGLADSGFGKEGVRYAVRDMTEDKLVVIHPGDAA
jgi:glyceraldehyde-3-phosphate dehydrogenase (NADP+)